jgi:TetR/AcrR family transcriptional regulator, transcriptional repressor for nem operon
MAPQPAHDTKTRLLDAAMHVIRVNGYAATTVEALCAEAGVSKGGFFHHFKNKDALALAAVEHFSAMAAGLFAAAEYRTLQDPVERLFGYIDFRAAMLSRELPEYTCLLGTLVQEIYHTHPDIRAACDHAMSGHIAELTRDVDLAKKRYCPTATWSAESVGYFVQAVLQGSFIFAKAKQNPMVAQGNLEHLRHYLELLFGPACIAKRRETS